MWSALKAPKSERCEDLWNEYIRDRKLEGVNVDQLNYRWKKLAPFFAHKLGSAINRQDCREYAKIREAEGVKPVTARTELELLRACLIKRYGKGNVKVWTPPASPPRDRYLTHVELERLLDAVVEPHIRLFITLAITTGARRGAILDAKWDAIDWNSKTINYNPAGRVKTNKRRTIVPLNRRALVELTKARAMAQSEWIIEYRGDRVKNVRKGIEQAAKRSGVPCSSHVFRHTAGVWMAQADIPMSKISQYLGHTTTRVTEQTYARYSPSYMRDASEALDF